MKERLKKLAPLIAYPVFYLVCLFVFALVTFPYEKLKERIVTTFNAQQRATNGRQELAIDEMSGYWLSGVKMKGVHLFSAATDPTKPPTDLKIDEATARVSMLGLLIGNKDVNFRIEGFGGTVKGSYDLHGKDMKVDVDLDGVDIGQMSMVADMVGLPTEGRLSGTVNIAMPEGTASKGPGAINLEIKDVAIGDGKAKLKGPIALALPKLSVGDVRFVAEAKDGVLKISKLAASGKDVELQGEGRIQMRELATESLCDISLRFKINDAFRSRTELAKSLFGAPGAGGPPPLFEMDPRVKSSKRPDGFYAWALRGALGKLEPTPAGGGAPGLGGGSAPPTIPGLQLPKTTP